MQTAMPSTASHCIGLPRYASFAASFALLVGLILGAAGYYRMHAEARMLFSSKRQLRLSSHSPGARVPANTEQTAKSIPPVAHAPSLAFGPLTEDGVVVVGPKQDLRQICMHYLGRYDPELIETIQRFNPLLVDPNHIFVGQRLRLPVDKIPQRHTHLQNNGRSDALTIALGNRHE